MDSEKNGLDLRERERVRKEGKEFNSLFNSAKGKIHANFVTANELT